MNEVLGQTAGNALEIVESIEFLKNENREARLNEVVLSLCAEMLIVSGLETEPGAARSRIEGSISSGAAAEIFSRMVAALGGPADFLQKYADYLPSAQTIKPVHSDRTGILAKVDAHAVGSAIIELGGGRKQLGDELDLGVGLTDVTPIGETVGPDRPLAVIHAANDADAEMAAAMIRSACTISADKPDERPIIYETLTAE
jgi:thymidine phosphorylase